MSKFDKFYKTCVMKIKSNFNESIGEIEDETNLPDIPNGTYDATQNGNTIYVPSRKYTFKTSDRIEGERQVKIDVVDGKIIKIELIKN